MIFSMFIGAACLLVFLLMAVLMSSRRLSALLALPLMALAIAVIAQIPGPQILTDVLSKGATKLNATYTTTMFGAMLAELLNKQGLAKSLIRWVAEFGGDNPFWLCIILTLATAALFSTIGGLGAVIMVGTIILPVMLSLGVSNITAGSLFLFGISLGGMFNIAGWQLYMDVLKLQQSQIIGFVLPFAMVLSLIIVVFLVIELRNLKNVPSALICIALLGGLCALLAQHAPAAGPTAVKVPEPTSIVVAAAILAMLAVGAIFRHRAQVTSNPPYALLTPILPLILVLFFNWDFIPAFMYGLAYCLFSTWKRNSVTVLTRAIIDGINSVIPAVVLMMGIGMLINCVSNPIVTASIEPLLRQAVPTHALSYVVVFTILAPLALYRGPLSLWGMGSGLVAVIQKSTALAGGAIMSMLLSVGQLQGICDPTNTANIWIATYLHTDTQVLLRRTVAYAWAAAFLGLCLAVGQGYVSFAYDKY